MHFTEQDVIETANRHYQLNAEAKALNGYDELNFLLKDKQGQQYILKIATEEHGYHFLDAQVLGECFWGFELQDVVPDIVVMGKPIGNGHPMAAVVTTVAIADAFNNGMEYFNTFGGNPVSMATGIAVLKTIQEEELQQHALQVGNHLMKGLKRLMDKHHIIGDVRGHGLFIGAELVRNRKTLEPAVKEINLVVEKMKDRGFFISTDGPLNNVLKIKPPMVFTLENADDLVKTLDEVLTELPRR
ncbi:MAG: aminotransferase class III-fold pyridoxal phosphate-dependent enzyme [Chitinophagaceae bacterium]